jgi:hypothetical protein
VVQSITDNFALAKTSKPKRNVDLASIPTVPFAWVDEHVYAAIRGCSVKVVQRERQEGIGCPYKKINGRTVRYRMGEIMAFLERQPGGGEDVPVPQRQCAVGRPRKVVT